MRDVVRLVVEKVRQGKYDTELRHNLLEILTDLPGDGSSKPCIWHPYGFISRSVGKTEDGGDVRLHIWPETRRVRQQPDWPVHRHSWGLHSMVLSGALVNEIYEIEPTQHSAHQLYAVGYTESTSLLNRTSTVVNQRLQSRQVYRVGDHYSMTIAQFHATYVREGQLTATLALTTANGDTSPSVVGEYGCANTYAFTRQPCDPNVYRAALDRILAQLVDGVGVPAQ